MCLYGAKPECSDVNPFQFAGGDDGGSAANHPKTDLRIVLAACYYDTGQQTYGEGAGGP